MIYGWANVESYQEKFRRSLITFWVGDYFTDDEAAKILAPVITVGLLIPKSDLIRLTFMSTPNPPLLALGHSRSIWSIPSRLRKDPEMKLIHHQAVDIPASNWFSSSFYPKDQGEIRVLQARIKRVEKEVETKKASSQKRRGFLARLFRPKVEDSLF